MNKSNVSVLFLFLFILGIASCSNEKYKVKSETDKNGYSYQTVTNDPTAVRIYTLKNGLKVYLSVNKDAPRIQTYVSVRAGSDLEPEESTGLAHYFEHLMFKGTDKLGTTDWAKEKVFLDEITDLFEQRRNTDDSIKKIKIFHQIDSVSVLASQYAIPSEYDKLMSAIGARGTNAFTSYETTTYVNDIPSNEILPWLTIEAERFSNISLRLFHTELETVYEEFNMGQDRDSYKAYYALMGNLFNKYPLHRKVIGYAKDLKNPSIINIRKFYDKYYVPNNIAVIMCGDLNPDSTIQLIDKTFGKLAEKPFERPVLPREVPITKPIEKSIYGPDAEFLQFAYRFSGDSTMDKKYVTLIDMILNNSQAGLIDLDLVQQQKVLRAGCSPSFFIDYGMHRFYAYPKQGQTLEQARDLVLNEIEKVKKGEFDDWLIKAVINDLRLNNIRSQESNDGSRIGRLRFARNPVIL